MAEFEGEEKNATFAVLDLAEANFSHMNAKLLILLSNIK